MKEFFLYSSFIDSWLSNEFYSQRFSKVDVLFYERIERIFYNSVSVYLQEKIGKELINMPSKRIWKDVIEKLVIDLHLLFLPTINEKDLTLTLTVKNPLIVDYIIDVDKTLVGVEKLQFLLDPVCILVLHVNISVESFIVEFFVCYLVTFISLLICFVKVI